MTNKMSATAQVPEREYKGIIPTGEQNNVINCGMTGDDVKVQAPAGSGKTYTLEALSNELHPKQGLYLAFNKAIADSAATKFGTHVDCRTGHSLAYRGVGWKYRERLGQKMTGMLIAKSCEIGDTSVLPTPASKGYMLIDALRRFCYSDDIRPEIQHMPIVKGPFSDEEVAQIRKEAIPFVRAIWEEVLDVKGHLPITHDNYLKAWALSNPQLDKNFILFDEAQDANPVILGVVNRQKRTQNIFVGDAYQQIYSWRGAINAMQKIETDHHCFITQSFRFGHAIADMANKVLGSYMPPSERPPAIIGFPEKESLVTINRIEDPDVIICRTNAGVITNVFKNLEMGKKVYVQGGVQNIINLLKGAQDLQNGRRSFVPDLALFHNWAEVVECSETESGVDLRSLVRMISEHGIPKLLEALNCVHSHHFGSDITITTGHKCKGLEWEKVKLFNDFLFPEKDETGRLRRLPQGEINILYVALTRALSVLDISACTACHEETLMEAKNSFEPPTLSYKGNGLFVPDNGVLPIWDMDDEKDY